MKRIYVVLLIFIGFFTIHGQESVRMLQGLSEISSENLMKTVNYLASKECAGRLPGHEGYNRAARYMASEFEKLHLKPLGDSGYFQMLNTDYVDILQPVELNLIENGSVIKKYKLGENFIYTGYSDSGSLTAPVVFCGYGLSQRYFDYDDFDGVDINQKIALIFQKLPDWERLDKSSPWWLDRGPGALGRGAVGVIGIEFKDEPIILSQYERNIHPAVLITKSVAEDLLNGSGHSLRDIKQRIDSLRKPFSFPLNKIIEMKVIGQYDRVPTMNVVALLEGSDSLLKNEYVVIGAHLDGQGFPSSDIFLPGANDNASGSAVVLEIARTFVRGKVQPKRSVVFVLFTGEEELSIGSRRFVEDPPIPLNRITSMIEFDCVGYGDSISIRKSAPKLWELTYMEDSIYTRMMSKIINRGPGADAAQFEEKGIPSVYFTTKNSSVHIHSTADLPDTFNQSLFEKITRLAYLTAFQVANGNYDREVVKK